MSNPYRFRIYEQSNDGTRVLVSYFHWTAIKEDGSLEWQLGPAWMDIPLDKFGNPLQGDALLTEISNRCPTSLIDRELAKLRRLQLGFEPVNHGPLMHQNHVVKQTSPVVMVTEYKHPYLRGLKNLILGRR